MSSAAINQAPVEIGREHLLDDEQVINFIIRGYHLVEPDLPEGLNEAICAELDALEDNPGDGILDAVPRLHDVYGHPAVRGALVSLLGADYQMHSHRHWHKRPGPCGYLYWHQDGTNQRHHETRTVLAMYYPHDVTPELGPTIIVPGTHFRNAPTDRMATYLNIRGQVPLTVKAGTVAITHYDLWHAAAANRTDRTRHMLKFLFFRGSEPTAPSWNHDPTEAAALTGRQMTFDPAVPCSQSDQYKQRALRRHMWRHMCGGEAPIGMADHGSKKNA